MGHSEDLKAAVLVVRNGDGTSMMALVVKLVSLSKYDANDKHCSKGIAAF